MDTPKWLDGAVFYNVYPQSFYDANGDGIGDLEGICQKLYYISDMGFNAIWLNPVYESPFRDGGYDVTDFYKIASRYGTNEDFATLCKEAKKRGIKIIMDLVAGHTSIECEWFKKSHSKSSYITIDVDNLMKMLKGEPWEPYKKKIQNY